MICACRDPFMPRPNARIFGIGQNYRAHALELGKGIPTVPNVFLRPMSSYLPNGLALVIPPISRMMDWEVELAVIIGKAGRYIDAVHALEHVAGYCVAIDFTEREFQNKESQWTPGKIFDGTLPLGPALISAEHVPNLQALALSLTVNGHTMQQSSTSDMIFSVAELIAYLSQPTELQPGDVIITGTPSGVGHGRNPKVYLKSGDRVVATVAGLGSLDIRVD